MTQSVANCWLLCSCHQQQLIALCRNVLCAEIAVPLVLHISIIYSNPSLTHTPTLHAVPEACVTTSSILT